MLSVEGYLSGSNEPKIHQNILKFATIDGKSVDVDV